MYWFTADTHFYHDNIRGYCNRPFDSVYHMDETLIENWNKKVHLDDIVFHLGDFSFGNQKAYESRLNGKIILLKGNHDDSSESVIRSMTIIYGGLAFDLVHDPEAYQGHNPLVLCGHVHDLWLTKTVKRKSKTVTFINVGVDRWNFEPIDIQQIQSVMRTTNTGGKKEK